MPVLRCSTIRRTVAEELQKYQEGDHGLPDQSKICPKFSSISNSEFIGHIRRKKFLIDKSLVLIDFLGDDGESPCTKAVLKDPLLSAASGSSLPLNQPKANRLKRTLQSSNSPKRKRLEDATTSNLPSASGSLQSSSNRRKQMRIMDATTSGEENHSSDSGSDSAKESSELDGCSRALISRPRRFGKTFNLSMMNDFLRVGDNALSEHGRRIVFQQTALWKLYPEFCAENFAKHPVIFVTFKVCEPSNSRFPTNDL